MDLNTAMIVNPNDDAEPAPLQTYDRASCFELVWYWEDLQALQASQNVGTSYLDHGPWG
jgi:hypothetical protein